MPQKLPVGVIGIGAMGMGVAKSLLRAGFEVHVRDVRPEAEAEAKAAGAVLCASPTAIAAAAHVIVTLVVDAPQTAEVLFGTDGVAHASDTRHVILMCSTIAPEDAQRFADR